MNAGTIAKGANGIRRELRRLLTTPLKIDMLQIAVVVTANFHNPSILHPSFLVAEGVVPKDWEPIDSEVVSTPVSSTVKYKNGVVFFAEPTKLQVLEAFPPEREFQTGSPRVTELVSRYVAVLPKVPYTAVGVNPQAFIATTQATDALRGRFIRPESLNEVSLPLTGLDLRLVYETDFGRLGVQFAPGLVTIAEMGQTVISREGIVVSGNYHRDARTSDEINGVIKDVPHLLDHFKNTIEALLVR